jgi:hypothetical protein
VTGSRAHELPLEHTSSTIATYFTVPRLGVAEEAVPARYPDRDSAFVFWVVRSGAPKVSSSLLVAGSQKLPRKRQRWSATTFLRDHWALDERRNARSTAFAISIFGTIVR